MSLGPGLVHVDACGDGQECSIPPGGETTLGAKLAASAGIWLLPHVALSLRIVGNVPVKSEESNYPTGLLLVGPHVQFQWTDRVWTSIGPGVGGGGGGAFLGLDMRVGFTLSSYGRSTLNTSFELTRLLGPGPGVTAMSALALVLGYQYR